MTRTMEITYIIILFSIITSMISSLGILPNINQMGAPTVNQNTPQTMVNQTVIQSGSTTNGYIGYFNIAIEVLQTIGSTIIGALIVYIPLTSLGVPAAIALAIQSALLALYSFDLIQLWRGQPW